ncbi:MAG TPA: hypothetical protein DCG28_02385 [Lachnospiraceae bacterium]|nr:hypothetical protein [Lachnospiraceae bacterium]
MATEIKNENNDTVKEDKNTTLVNTNKKRKNGNFIYVIIIAVIVVSALVYVAFKVKSISELGSEGIVFSNDYSVSSKTDFSVSKDTIFFCTKDGLSVLDKQGNVSWTDTFSLNSPVLLTDGGFAGVADENGHTLSVYNSSGKLYSCSTDGAITTFAVNPKGYSGVIYQNNTDSDYILDIYSASGELLTQGRYIIEDGIPTCIDISDDGKYFAVGFINIKNLKPTSGISFFYSDKDSAKLADNSDGMFSALNLDTNIIASMRFMPDNSCIVVTDNYMLNIGGGNAKTYVENWRVDFSSYITAAKIIDNEYIALAFGTSKQLTSEEKEEEKEKENTVYCYNYRNGKQTCAVTLSAPANELHGSLEAFIVGCDNNYEAYDIRGKKLWSYSALQPVNNISFYNKLTKVIIATTNKLTLYNIKNGSNLIDSVSEIKTNKQEDNTETQSSDTEKNTEEITEETTQKKEKTTSEGEQTDSEEQLSDDTQNEDVQYDEEVQYTDNEQYVDDTQYNDESQNYEEPSYQQEEIIQEPIVQDAPVQEDDSSVEETPQQEVIVEPLVDEAPAADAENSEQQ